MTAFSSRAKGLVRHTSSFAPTIHSSQDRQTALRKRVMRKQVFIELTRSCNFDCDFCPHHHVTRPSGVMSLDDLWKTLSALSQAFEIEYVMFSNMGEPTLHPNFDEACRMVKAFGHTLYVTTNGSLLREKHKNTLPVDYWCISYRSTSAEAFAHRRSTLSFDDYTQTIRGFIEDNFQHITLYIMGNKEWFHRENASFAGIDLSDRDLVARTVNTIAKTVCPQFCGVTATSDNIDTYISLCQNIFLYVTPLYSWASVILPKGVEVQPRQPAECPFGYYNNQIVVYWNGQVTPCCLDYDGELVIGNALQEPMTKIIARAASRLSAPFCRRCAGTVVNAKAR